MKKKINTHKAPAAIGPYSQGIETDTLIFLSGQIPLDPEKRSTHIRTLEKPPE